MHVCRLFKFSMTEEDFRKRFFHSKQMQNEIASQYLARLEHYMNQWVYLSKIEQSFDALKELVLRNQFLHSCPHDLALFLREVLPVTWTC